ncbi:MAG: DNA (cytosine-5-)-methyltransferase [Lachnospiraceae bacterium]|nr:DNA (cytosine-5-)-methyltransferase [Lachnospiraceae bacterium]
MERLKREYPNQFDYELVAWCEIEPAAIKAHNALFPQWSDRNLGDITLVNPDNVPNCDVITWSFPCQAISNAGKQAGFKDGSGTTSSLAWECIKIFKAKRPKYLLMENVAAICQRKFANDFALLRKAIEDLGYVNYWELKNAKDFQVPQNRLRCFMVSILRAEDDPNPTYNFPAPMPLEKCVEDYMIPIEEVPEDAWIDQNRVSNAVVRDILDQPNVYEELLWRYHVEEASRRLFGRFDFKFMEEHYDELSKYAVETLGATNPDKPDK